MKRSASPVLDLFGLLGTCQSIAWYVTNRAGAINIKVIRDLAHSTTKSQTLVKSALRDLKIPRTANLDTARCGLWRPVNGPKSQFELFVRTIVIFKRPLLYHLTSLDNDGELKG